MNTRISSQTMDISEAFRDFIQRRARTAFKGLEHRVDEVELRVNDVNGPRGGEDKTCRVRIRGPSLSIIVTEKGADAYAAASRVLRRAGQALARQAKRHGPRARLEVMS